MIHLEAKFTFTPFDENFADGLCYLLSEMGFDNFTTEQSVLRAYATYPGEQTPKAEIEKQIRETINTLGFETQIGYELSDVPFQNWNEEWEKHYFQPIIIGQECAIHSSFHKDIPTVKYDIVIDPKMAFGTGNHETTSLMIAELLALEVEDQSFLDMGCGTAVLAILAALRGASPVVGIDIEEPAYENALENINLNGTPSIDIRLGGAEQLGEEECFDIVFANINRNILLADMNRYAARMKSGSQLFMSGFYQQDIPMIENKANRLGLKLCYFKEKNNWVATRFEKE